MKPILWRHRVTAAALFGLSVLVTVTPTSAILASSLRDPQAIVIPQAEAVEDFGGVELSWEPIDVNPEPEPVPVPDAAEASEADAEAPTREDPVYKAPMATRTPRAAAREAADHTQSTPAKASKPAKKATKCLDPDPRIQDLGDGRYEVDRQLAESYSSIERLRTLGFVAPHQDASGQPDGYRLGGIQCGNALHQSGLRRGDVIRAVNGRPTRNALQIMTAWLSERDADVVRVEILREGKRRTLVYRLT